MQVDDEDFQYVLTRPINKYYLLNMLGHFIKLQSLYSEMPACKNCSKKLNIIVVDDNYFCRKAIVRLMNMYTLKITECENGQEALLKILESTEIYQLGIIDYQMPKMNGIELIKNIRKMEISRKSKHMSIVCNWNIDFSFIRRRR